MKKLILYLGLLCVLFSTPQLANAYTDLYLRGEVSTWDNNPGAQWKLKTADGNIYTISGVRLEAGKRFKIADATWSNDANSWGKIQNIEANKLASVQNYANADGDAMTVTATLENATITLNINAKKIIISNGPYAIKYGKSGETGPDMLFVYDSASGMWKADVSPATGQNQYGLFTTTGPASKTQKTWLGGISGQTLAAGGSVSGTLSGNGSWSLGGKSYTITWSPTETKLSASAGSTSSAVPSALYVSYDVTGTWVHASTPLTPSDKKFSGTLPDIASGKTGYVTFFTKYANGWDNRGDRYTPTNATTQKNATFSDNIKLNGSNPDTWQLGSGSWTYTIDFTNASKPSVTFTKKVNGGDVVRHTDTWKPQAGEIYVFGNLLNGEKPNPGYRMNTTDGVTYTLDRFVIQENSQFWLEEYTSETAHTRHSANASGDVAVTGKESNLTFDASGNQKVWWWNNGVTMISLSYNKGSNKLTLTPHKDVPNQGNFDGGVAGVPFVAFVGDNLAQTPATDNIFGASTADGWHSGWQAYSSDNKPLVMESTVNDLGDKDRAIPNTVWPPRNRVDFAKTVDKKDYTWTSAGISFTVDKNIVNKTFTKAQALAELTQQGILMNADDQKEIPDQAVWTRYNTRNTTIVGRYKLWSGWAGTFNGTSADWSKHHNWGRGTFNASASEQVMPNYLYYAKDEISDGQGGNFNFDKEQYFREFSFYSARKSDGTYKYFFVARLAAEDPMVTIHRVDGDRTALKADYAIQHNDNVSVSTKKIVGYDLYLSDPDGETFTNGPVKSETFTGGISVTDFNARTTNTFTASGLEAGSYRYKIVVRYDSDINQYTGESPVMSVFPSTAPNLRTEQYTYTDADDEEVWTFDILVNGSVPVTLTDEQKELVKSYRLTIEGSACSHTKWSYGDTEALVNDNRTITLAADENHNMPQVKVLNALARESYAFTLEMIMDESAGVEMPKARVPQYVYAPRATLAVSSIGFVNDKEITEDSYPNESLRPTDWEAFLENIHTAHNHVKVEADIRMPKLDASVTAHYKVGYSVRYETFDGGILEALIPARNPLVTTPLTIDNLPYSIDPETGGPVATASYQFPIATVYYFEDNVGFEPVYTPYVETPLANIFAKEFPAPRVGNSGIEIKVSENYVERFHGHHAHWYDAFVAMDLESLPVKGGLAGSFNTETRNDSEGLAPVEAGGMYAYANVKRGEDDFDHEKYLWHQTMPSDHDATIHDHYYLGNTVSEFYAGHGTNQFFCTVNHTDDPASMGFGDLSKWEMQTYWPEQALIAYWEPAELQWYYDKKVYRKIHHVNHEGRYFATANDFEDHKKWKFPLSEYEDLSAEIRYRYTVLTSADNVTILVSPDVPGEEVIKVMTPPAAGPASIMAKEAAEPVYADVILGAPEKISFKSNPVTEYEYGNTTGIGNVTDDDDTKPIEYYDLQGRKVNNPAAGVYIFRQGSRTGKVLIK